MTTNNRWKNRYWGDQSPPKAKAEFFNAVTSPAPSGTGTVATIRMYGPIDSWGGYWGISTKDVGAVLDALPDSVTQIILRINSPGGEVFEGVSILNMLRSHKAEVTAVVDGLAASAASVIAAGCSDTVMSPGTQMMIHSPMSFAYGNAGELRKTAEVLDTIESSLIEIYTAKGGEKDWVALLADETWMNAAEAVSMGLADRVAVIPDAGEAATVGEEEPADEADTEHEFNDRANQRLARASVLATSLPSSTGPGDTNRKENVVDYDAFKAGLRERLGVTDAAISEEQLLAAVDESLAEQVTDTSTVPEGTVLIDAGVLAQLQGNAQAGVKALAAQDAARRDAIVNSAVDEGRIAPASRDTWRAQLDANEAGTTSLISSLAANAALPVVELGIGVDAVTDEHTRLAAAAGWTDQKQEA
ncbi:head maturation protease, ClpP-related [Lysinibacter cavernae]|uniref:ATP-dependent Clp protease proteolytic subunit n=1 Tax=Lysinibacter cavernae TaxID=1640652 RepID=A0A7X5TS53_9MICO|nr:head maturation protease, ClpP-related [Lysinibacter cavernae]NIH52540.1 ATP-dependent protease ClpP protease subunit [Lysinibacter cavernae]